LGENIFYKSTNEKLINRILELEIKRISSPDGNGNPRIIAAVFSRLIKATKGSS
jgi:hypothetical protein